MRIPDPKYPPSEPAVASDRIDDGTISRRAFIRDAVVASAAATAAAAWPVTAVGAPSPSAYQALTGGQQRSLERVLNRLIPAEGAMPAAGDLGIVGFIEKALEAAPHLRSPVVGLLAALPDEARFRRMSDAEADAILEQLAAEHPKEFDLVVQATYTGYYSHSRVQEILEWVDPVDTGYRGARFDETGLVHERLRPASNPGS
jgi:hypothetical protein